MTAKNKPASCRTFSTRACLSMATSRVPRHPAGHFNKSLSMERETGIEPALVAWKATVLPLNYSRAGRTCLGIAPSAGEAFGYRFAPDAIYRRASLNWWREVDYCGHPALRPSGASPSGCSNPLLRICRTGRSSVVRTHLVQPSRVQSWWREVDSNHRRRKPADLQSAPVGRLGIPPFTEPRIVLAWGCQCQGWNDGKTHHARCDRNAFRTEQASGSGRPRFPSSWRVRSGAAHSRPGGDPRRWSAARTEPASACRRAHRGRRR